MHNYKVAGLVAVHILYYYTLLRSDLYPDPSLITPLSLCTRFRFAARATLRLGSIALAFGSLYLPDERRTLNDSQQ